MHKRQYYRNSYGDIDHHAMKIAGKYHDARKIDMCKLSAVNDGNAKHDIYTIDVQNTLGANVEGLNTNRGNTKLALKQPLGIVPRDEIAGALRERKFSIMPGNTLPTPVKSNQIRLAA